MRISIKGIGRAVARMSHSTHQGASEKRKIIGRHSIIVTEGTSRNQRVNSVELLIQ